MLVVTGGFDPAEISGVGAADTHAPRTEASVLVAVALISVVDLKETGDTCVAWKRSVLGLASQSLRESQKNLRDC